MPVSADEPDAPIPLSGRRAQAARNDDQILMSARAVFLDDPGAPISAVAARAGVGISALYRRYPSKEDLLRTLCADGLHQYADGVQAALTDDRDPWTVFVSFMERGVDADASSLIGRLAGTFTPTPEMFVDADRAQQLNVRFFRRMKKAGVIREDTAVGDLALIFEQVAAIRFRDPERTKALRRRCLAIHLDGLRPGGGATLPGPAVSWPELGERWTPEAD